MDEHDTGVVEQRKPAGTIPCPSLFVVGIGASAGGLESLEQFFAKMPHENGMAFVLIQHLSPDFKSMMNELLSRYTSMAMHRADEGMRLEPNHIYLLPPKKEMIISEGRLHLTDKDPKQGLTLPIDHFFRSLAQDCGSKSIAVILSGTGSDGSRGIKDVHQAGGLVLCENEQTAKFDGMPLSAQATGFVDAVLHAGEMPAALLEYVRSPQRSRLGSKSVHAEPLAGIEAVFDLLRRQHDIDFSHYKPTTVSRRIERRLSLIQIDDLDNYVERLRNDAEELNALYKDLLIGVTKFFRDDDPFLLLEREIVPDLLQRVPDDEGIRAWVAGCATGEEAYSLAILLHEALTYARRPLHLKLFATDVHQTSLEHAALGSYDADQLAAVTESRLQRYFRKKGDRYQISQELRQLIVFARHNVIKDAPFTNLDLISCRNLLIYFQPNAQKKAISLFHFGLKTGGTLLLGSSESPGQLADEFETLHEHSRLYRKRRDLRLPADLPLPLSHGTQGLRARGLASSSSANHSADSTLIRLHDHLLDQFMPPSLLINERRELIESFGGAEQWLHVQKRRLSQDVLDMLRTETKIPIAGALNRVMRRGQPLSFEGVRLTNGHDEQLFRLNIAPMQDAPSQRWHYLITLEPQAPRQPQSPSSPAEVDVDEMACDQLRHLEEELCYTKENLQATIEELETSNEEMQATNEELVASNEELQSTNEELHSVNEELFTVNAEYQKKIGELAELNQDMEHLLRSTDVAIVFLDHDLRIRKFTPKVAELFDLVERDIGRRVSTFAHRIRHESLAAELQTVLKDGLPLECEVRDLDHRCFFMRILPYRVSNGIKGVVLSLIDISVLEEARSRISHLSAIVESSEDAIISFDLQGRISSWNAAAERTYEFTADEAIGQDIALIVPDHRLAETRSWFERLRRGKHMEAMEVERLTKAGHPVHVSLAFSPIKDSRGAITGISGISRDISERKQAEETRAYLSAIVKSSDDAIVGRTLNGFVTSWNLGAERLYGYTADEMLGQTMTRLVPLDRSDEVPEIFELVRQGKLVEHFETVRIRKDGTQIDVSLTISPIHDSQNQLIGVSTIARDIRQIKEAVEKLREEARRREQFLAMLSHELRNPLSAIRTATQVLTTPGVVPSSDAASRRVIDRQTTQMTRLLDDLLDVSRITQDKIRLNKSTIDLRDTVENAVHSVQTLAGDCHVGVEVHLPDEPLPVEGDVTRLEQIQSNLLSNAIKYSPHGERVSLTLAREEESVLIRVKDRGAGIAPEMLDRIFDIFVQADDTLDRARGGMGVGLTLVRKLVDLHGGTLSVFSEGLGRGSEFAIRFPLATAPRTAEINTSLHIRSRRITRLVVIEDQDDNRNMLSRLLELYGIEVHSAASGPSGLLLIEHHQPPAAIIDIGLPEMDGYEVARRIRTTLGDTIVLVALTGYGQFQDVARARAAGFDHHLVKPLEIDELAAILGLRGSLPVTK